MAGVGARSSIGKAAARLTASTLHKELEETRHAAGMPTWERNK